MVALVSEVMAEQTPRGIRARAVLHKDLDRVLSLRSFAVQHRLRSVSAQQEALVDQLFASVLLEHDRERLLRTRTFQICMRK